MTTTTTRQYKSGRNAALAIARAVAAEIVRLGHQADAADGPAFRSPDDELTLHCAHVTASPAAWAAYDESRRAARAAR